MDTTAIVGGRVIDGTGRDPIPDGTILIGGERILNIFRRGEQPIPSDCEIVDASGKTVVPGLIDSHVHVGELPHNRFNVPDPDALCDRFLGRFTAHGVTTVRDTGSPALDESLFELKAGRPSWPRIFSSGPDLDGPPGGPWPGLRVVRSPSQAEEETARLIDAGADFIKAYVWMEEPVLRAVVETAHRRGVRVAAHVGHVLTVEEAVRVGVDACEHVRVGRELLSNDQLDELAALPVRRHDHLISFRPWRYIDPDSEVSGRLLDLLVERGVFLTPTLTISWTVLQGNSSAVRAASSVLEMEEAIRSRWDASSYTADYSQEDWKAAPTELSRQLAFIGRARRHGVRITAGTDTPNPFIPPGFSLHRELELLVESGLKSSEAIRAATHEAAALLGVERDLGSLEKGKLADLLVVDGDPLAEIGDLRRIVLVMKGGRIL